LDKGNHLKAINAGAALKGILFLVAFELLLFGLSALFPTVPRLFLGIFWGSLISVAGVILTWIFIKWDGRTLADLGFIVGAGSLVRLFKGLLAGVAVFGAMITIYLIFTPVTFERALDASLFDAILLSCLVFICLSLMEEIAFRGYTLQKLQDAIGTRGAVYLTSVAFGLYHGLTVEAALGPATWGLTYAVLALWSKGLAIPVGFHAGVNYAMALIGEKPRYADAVWTAGVVDEKGLEAINLVSNLLQGLVLVGGIILVEVYIARKKRGEV
jgi:membrane protease YdiL (CAAX protease family)